MVDARPIALKVRPIQSADLCFGSGGIIGEDNPQLASIGAHVDEFDLTSVYNVLGQSAGGSRPGQLKFDSDALRSLLKPVTLLALRNAPQQCLLDKAIAARENAYYQKHVNQSAVVNEVLKLNNTALPDSKPSRLSALVAIIQRQHDELNAAYVADGKTGVIKSASSDMTSASSTGTTSDGTSTNTSTGTSTSNGNQNTSNKADSSGTSGPAANPSANKTGSHTDGTSSTTTTGSGTSNTNTTGTTHNATASQTNTTQHTNSTGYDYKHPTADNTAQLHRAQLGLLDEMFTQFMAAQPLPFLGTVFDNELKAVDLDVKRLQVDYINCFLVSPIMGTITGRFRDKGDYVQAGQPVLRVENDVEIYLVGTIKYRGLIAGGMSATVTTRVYDTPTPLTVKGKVVSVRGHDAEDEQWDVLIRCKNRPDTDPNGLAILPLNYNFDYDDTSIAFS